MDVKESIEKIKEILKLAPAKVEAAVEEKKEEVKKEEKAEEVTVAKDFTPDIEALRTELSAVKAELETVKAENTAVKTAFEKHGATVTEAVNNLIAVVEKMSEQPTAESTEKPKAGVTQLQSVAKDLKTQRLQSIADNISKAKELNKKTA